MSFQKVLLNKNFFKTANNCHIEDLQTMLCN